MIKYIVIIAVGLFCLDVFYFQKANAVEWNEAFNDAHEEVLFCGDPETVGYYLGAKYGLMPLTAGTSFDMMTNEHRLTVFAANPDLTVIAILTQYGNKVCLTSLSVGHVRTTQPPRGYQPQ